MTPEELAYKILQDSNYIRVPEENPGEIIEYFLDSAKGCGWDMPTTDIERRQFETSLKSWFKQYEPELIKFAKENPPTFEGREKELINVYYQTMDDQGFCGQVMEDGVFLRNFQDVIDTQQNRKYKEKSDGELESMWQAQCTMIQMSLTKAYDENTDKAESERCFEMAKTAQGKQERIQEEITRRARN